MNKLDITFVIEPDLPMAKEMGRLVKSGLGKVINWYTMDLEELSFIAKYRILPAQTIIIISGNKVVCRLVNVVPTVAKLNKLIKRIYEDTNSK
jgi:hypothetical protein